MARFQLIATSPMGLEAVVAREIKELGYSDMQVENGRVTFWGDEAAICRANLWLRTADRILVKMGSFTATTFEQLFAQTKALPWSDWIPVQAEFPVQGRSYKSQLSSVPACQAIVKKAIVESLKERHHTEWFAETGPRYAIEVAMHGDVATLTLDTSGYGLHKRGYRKLVTEAPLKETMAAALVLLSRWRAERPLLDPFCGSGTILIEAAMIAWNIAPGLRRSFAAEAWANVPPQLWHNAREEAFDLLRDTVPLDIRGSDIDSQAIESAQSIAKSAGLSREIRFDVAPVSQIHPTGDDGCIITNPPYGERLGDEKQAELAIRQLGELTQTMPAWSTFILSPNKHFEHFYGRPAVKKRKLFNGRIECNYFQYLASGGLFPKKKR